MRKLILCVVFALIGRPTFADPITFGTLLVNNTSSAEMHVSNSTFEFTGYASPFFGNFAPLSCMVSGCPSGTEIDISAFWSGMDLRGTVTNNGQSYDVGSLSRPASMTTQW